jgi:hypothetical protein
MKTPYSETLLFDTEVPTNTTGHLTLIVQSIFRTVEFNDVQRAAYQHLLTKVEKMVDASTVCRELLSYFSNLVAQLGNSALTDAVVAELYKTNTHEANTAHNDRAYSRRGKVDPAGIFWPDARPGGAGSIFEKFPSVNSYPLIRKDTAVGSMGSCFATEVAHSLQRGGYNYVVTEHYESKSNPGMSDSCAKWGVLFNTPSFRQLLEKVFGMRKLPRLLWTNYVEGQKFYCDPFRESVYFNSIEEYESEYDSHIEKAKEALLSTEVFVLTLGLSETWSLISDPDIVFSRSPNSISPALVQRNVLTPEDNLRELESMLNIWRAHNPGIKFIVSVSPIPLHATFRGNEHHVIEANCYSKSCLRVVAEEFVRRNKGVYYMPSYETVMYCTKDAWHADQRHVARHTVEKVMELFAHRFLVQE